MSLSRWSPSFAQKVTSLDGTRQSPDIIVFFGSDYHEFYDIDEKYEGFYQSVVCEENAVFTSANAKDDYQYIVCLNQPLTEELYARLIIEANKIKSLDDFPHIIDNAENYDDFIFNRVVRRTPKTNKAIYKRDDDFLDTAINPIWATLLPATAPVPIKTKKVKK